jgi:hypothetical protein
MILSIYVFYCLWLFASVANERNASVQFCGLPIATNSFGLVWIRFVLFHSVRFGLNNDIHRIINTADTIHTNTNTHNR